MSTTDPLADLLAQHADWKWIDYEHITCTCGAVFQVTRAATSCYREHLAEVIRAALTLPTYEQCEWWHEAVAAASHATAPATDEGATP
jgi:hypothetical protein